MSHDEFAGKFTAVTATVISSSAFNAAIEGLQDEIEETREMSLGNGVLSGMAGSIDDPDIDIAAGDAICEGKRFSGGESVTFTGSDPAVTHWIYIDPTDEDDPYKKATSDPGDGYLLICKADWDGATTLSALVDLRVFGIVAEGFNFNFNETIAGAEERKFVIPDRSDGRSFFIEGVTGGAQTCGSGAGPTYVDVLTGAGGSETTIWGTSSDRLTIAHDDTDGEVLENIGAPDQNRTVDGGEAILVQIAGSPATGVADIFGTVHGYWLL